MFPRNLMNQRTSKFDDYPNSSDDLNQDDLEYLSRTESKTDEILLPPKPPKPEVHTTDPKLLAELMSSDEALWERAWFEFNERYKYYIYSVGIQAGCGPDLAQDLVNTVLLRVRDKIGLYDRSKGKFRSWLWKVSHNIMRDELRKNRRIQEILQAFQAQPASSGGSGDFIKGILENPDDESSFDSLTERALTRLADSFKGKPDNIEVFRKYAIEFSPAAKVAKEFKISRERVWSVKSQLMPEFTQALKTVLHEESRL